MGAKGGCSPSPTHSAADLQAEGEGTDFLASTLLPVAVEAVSTLEMKCRTGRKNGCFCFSSACKGAAVVLGEGTTRDSQNAWRLRLTHTSRKEQQRNKIISAAYHSQLRWQCTS